MKRHQFFFLNLFCFVIGSCADRPPVKEMIPTVKETPSAPVEEKKEAPVNQGLQAQLRDPSDMFTYQGADGKEANRGNPTGNPPSQPWNRKIERTDETVPTLPPEKP